MMIKVIMIRKIIAMVMMMIKNKGNYPMMILMPKRMAILDND